MEMSQVNFFLLKESRVNTKLEIIFEVIYIKVNRGILFPLEGMFRLIIFLPPFREARVTSVFTINKQAGGLESAPEY